MCGVSASRAVRPARGLVSAQLPGGLEVTVTSQRLWLVRVKGSSYSQ